jgi:hypothetical protein
MLDAFLFFALAACSAAFCWNITRKMIRRLEIVERDLQRVSDGMSQLMELQMKTHQKFSTHFDDMEERIMELSVPSQDSNLPLERRHQVLALARQGVELEEIVKRLKAPVGEAQLILNLSKYMGGESAPAGKIHGQVRQYA